jgi:hypothetical protein
VNFSPALKWLLLILLPLTLAWKLAARPMDERDPMERVAEFLIRQHFQVAEVVSAGMPIEIATTPQCRMLVGMPSSYGSHRDTVRSLGTGTDRVFIVFRGQIYAEQPIWLTAFHRLWSKLLYEFGLGQNITPVFAVIAPPSCEAEKLPWHELG